MMSMFHNVPYISKKNVVFFLWSKLIPDTWRYLLAFAFETLQLPFVRRCVAAMPLQTKKCHYCRNANRCKRLSNSDLETTPSRVSTSPSRTGPEHFRPILSVLPPATAPKAPACPNGAICALQATSLTTFDSEKNTSSRNSLPLRIPATSYNKIGIAINSHLAGSDPSTAHLMDVPILTNFQSHGVRMFDEKSHLWKKRS